MGFRRDLHLVVCTYCQSLIDYLKLTTLDHSKMSISRSKYCFEVLNQMKLIDVQQSKHFLISKVQTKCLDNSSN
jgi:hypothetical protein